MTIPVKFTGDLAELPTHAYGHRSLTWWGVVSFFLIEGTAFVLALAAYFYLMSQEQACPRSNLGPHQLATQARHSSTACWHFGEARLARVNDRV